MSARSRNRGFALIAALFLLIVLGALGLYATRIATTQDAVSAVRLLEIRTQRAADLGIEWARARIAAGACPAGPTLIAIPSPIFSGTRVTVSCTNVGSGFYEVTSKASWSSYGRPDFVYREKQRQLP
jgi:MSHA biogenesis protein MshP